MAKPRDPFELMEPPAADPLLPSFGVWVWFACAAMVLAALGATLFFVARKRRARAADAPTLRESAYQDAVAALGGISGADGREAAVRCSLVLRDYLVKALSDPALFETHEEFIARHDALQGLAAPAREAAQRGFSLLAEAKYAPDPPARPPDELVGESRELLETLHRGLAA